MKWKQLELRRLANLIRWHCHGWDLSRYHKYGSRTMFNIRWSRTSSIIARLGTIPGGLPPRIQNIIRLELWHNRCGEGMVIAAKLSIVLNIRTLTLYRGHKDFHSFKLYCTYTRAPCGSSEHTRRQEAALYVELRLDKKLIGIWLISLSSTSKGINLALTSCLCTCDAASTYQIREYQSWRNLQLDKSFPLDLRT